jgi:hypothetical protein
MARRDGDAMSGWDMAEAELQKLVLDRCEELGLRVQWTRRAKDSQDYVVPGWPDLVILGKRTLFRELKRTGERPTPDQRKVGILLQMGGCDWSVWTPVHWLDGTIEQQLQSVRWEQ